MLERTIKESWTLEDVAELKSRLARLRRGEGLKKPFYEQCQIWVQDAEKKRQEKRREAEERGEEFVEGVGEMVSFLLSHELLCRFL